MPEGDSLHGLAARLRPRLEGQQLERCRLRDRGAVAALERQVVDEVRAVGKHLLIGVGGRWYLRIHLGMRGRVRSYPAACDRGDRDYSASVVLVTSANQIVFRETARADVFPKSLLPEQPGLRELGPDLVSVRPDLTAIVRRARAPQHRGRAISELLLDQRVAAGVGNVYKSEVLFMAGLHPWRTVASLGDGQLTQLYGLASELLVANSRPGKRRFVRHRTRPFAPAATEQRLWVYRRTGRACLRCRTVIRSARRGESARTTYWCPTCQPEDGS